MDSKEAVLYLDEDLTERSFLEPLVCALEDVLVAPVLVKSSSVPLGRDLLMNARQYDAEKVAERFRSATRAEGDPRAFKHLIIGQDITVRSFNYLFASSFGARLPDAVRIISTARLSASGLAGTDFLVERLYKIIMRGLAHNAGFSSEGCVMAYANNLEEHVKAQAGSTCAPLISQRPEPGPTPCAIAPASCTGIGVR